MGNRRACRIYSGLIAGSLGFLPAPVSAQVPDSPALPLPPLPASSASGAGESQPPAVSVPVEDPTVPMVVPGQPSQVPLPDAPGSLHPQGQSGPIRGFVKQMWGYVDPENAEIISMHQLACLIDKLDKALHNRGQVVVKSPDVWGQNRLTQHRAEYEDQMKKQLDTFEVILSSYQRRADLAALTSATSIGASVAPRISNSRNVTATTNVTPAPAPAAAPAIPSAAGLVGPNGLVANANSLIGTSSPLLMPSDLKALALSNKGAAQGLGIEPNVLLDERSNFLNHLHQLRRNSAGDDRSDMPGYGLYLARMPVSILPGAESIKGKGAMVTVQAKHHLTPDLLANTFRNVVILDTAYQLLDAVSRGQYLQLSDRQNCDCEEAPHLARPFQARPCDDPQPPTPTGSSATKRQDDPQPRFQIQSMAPQAASRPGLSSGSQGTAPASEVVAIYGRSNLNKLICALKADQESWFRHDPSVVSWLLSELSAAHDYLREQARTGNALFQPAGFESLGNLAMIRDYQALAFHRERWLQAVATQRNEPPDESDPTKKRLRVRPIDVLAFGLMVQSVFVDRQLKYDMHLMSQRKGLSIGDPYPYCFHALWPDAMAQHAFNKYVECKWPIHVFSLDPILDQQNQLDLYSARTELQLALATAIATGQASFQNATTYARRLEQDLAAINLNRTSVGFGAGETTFGWRFYPRIQTPPTQSNPRRILGILVNNGPGLDYSLNNLRIEPGQRECYALMVVPNFASTIKMTTIINWFDLKTCHPDQELETTDMLGLGRKLQTAREAMQRLCDSGRYRPVDLELLHDRLDQLDAMLPMQSHSVVLPFEADLSGSEIFTSINAALGPRLLTWYGEPGRAGGSIFILGTGFSVRDMKVIAGGVTLKDTEFDLISRNVLRITIPDGSKAIPTPVVFHDPSVVCFNQGKARTENGWCDDCAALKGAARVAEVAVKEAEVAVKRAAVTKAKADLTAAEAARVAAQSADTTARAKATAAEAAAKADPNNAAKAEAAKTARAEADQAAKSLSDATQRVSAAQAAVEAAEAAVQVAIAAARKAGVQPTPKECQCKQRSVIDVHVATSNGISNHLLVEVAEQAGGSGSTASATTTVTTTTQPNPADGSTKTTTTFQTPASGASLPPGTFLPMGTTLPAGGTFVAPGAAVISSPPPSPAPAPGASTPAKSAQLGPGAQTDSGALAMPAETQELAPVPPTASALASSSAQPPAPAAIAMPSDRAGWPPLPREAAAPGTSGPPRRETGRVDPGIRPTSAPAPRAGRRSLLSRTIPPIPAPSTRPSAAPPTRPPEEKRSRLSRILGGFR